MKKMCCVSMWFQRCNYVNVYYVTIAKYCVKRTQQFLILDIFLALKGKKVGQNVYCMPIRVYLMGWDQFIFNHYLTSLWKKWRKNSNEMQICARRPKKNMEMISFEIH